MIMQINLTLIYIFIKSEINYFLLTNNHLLTGELHIMKNSHIIWNTKIVPEIKVDIYFQHYAITSFQNLI